MLGFHEAHRRRGILTHPACEVCAHVEVSGDQPDKQPDTVKHFPAWVLEKRRKIRARKKEMAA